MSRNNGSNANQAVLIEERKPQATLDPIPASGAAQEISERPHSKTRLKKLLPFLALPIVIGACWYGYNSMGYESTDDAQVQGHVMQLSARVSGQVQQVNVIEGQQVHAGDVLLVIDPKDYQIDVDQARANLADAVATVASSHLNVPITTASAFSSLDSAKAAVLNAAAGVDAAKHNLEAAKAALAQAEANAEKTDADLTRYEQLVAKEDISRQQYDQAVAAAKANRAGVVSASASVQSAEQSLRQAEGRLLQAKADQHNAETAPEQVSVVRAKADAAAAQVERCKAAVAQAELNLSYTVIRTPVSGIVGKKTVELAENVSIGQQLVIIVPLDDIWVTANFKETQLAHMRPGQPVDIKVDAYGRAWAGHITNMGGGTGSVFSLLPPENATGNYVKVVQRVPVRIDFDHSPGQEFNSDGLLKPGLSVQPEARVR
jgi:membrane fusion protein (multidrug efflux system)